MFDHELFLIQLSSPTPPLPSNIINIVLYNSLHKLYSEATTELSHACVVKLQKITVGRDWLTINV